jgi:hypothetical protein
MHQELRETCTLHYFNIGCYGWIVAYAERSLCSLFALVHGAVTFSVRHMALIFNRHHALGVINMTCICTSFVITKGSVGVRLTAMFVCLLSWRTRVSGKMLK